jgi:hypothetical protein
LRITLLLQQKIEELPYVQVIALQAVQNTRQINTVVAEIEKLATTFSEIPAG